MVLPKSREVFDSLRENHMYVLEVKSIVICIISWHTYHVTYHIAIGICRAWSVLSQPTTHIKIKAVAPLKKDGISYSELTDQVEILNEQFVSAFTKKDETSMLTSTANTVPPLNSSANTVPPLNNQVNGVMRLLLSQNPHKASGLDQISPRFPK